jgi:hypothetical protein
MVKVQYRYQKQKLTLYLLYSYQVNFTIRALKFINIHQHLINNSSLIKSSDSCTSVDTFNLIPLISNNCCTDFQRLKS